MKKKSLLDSVKVESPCGENWDEMIGNDKVRFCSHCATNVHNLSAMTTRKAEQLLKNSNGELCVRYAKTPAGEPITLAPPPVKITRRAMLAAGVLATSLTFSTAAYSQGEPNVKKGDGASVEENKSSKKTAKEPRGIISGTVKDIAGALVISAKITLIELKTKNTRFAQSNDEGNYQLRDIAPGWYELSIENPGFIKAAGQKVEVSTNSKLIINAVLEAAETTVGLIETYDKSLIETEIKLVDKNVVIRQIENLPLNSRQNFFVMGLHAAPNTFKIDGTDVKEFKPAKKRKRKKN